MRADLRLLTVAVDRSLDLVGTLMSPLLGLDLVTRTQGMCLGLVFFLLLAASVALSWSEARRPILLVLSDPATRSPCRIRIQTRERAGQERARSSKSQRQDVEMPAPSVKVGQDV